MNTSTITLTGKKEETIIALKVKRGLQRTIYYPAAALAILLLFMNHLLKNLLMRSNLSASLLFVPGINRLRSHVGRMKAWYEFVSARAKVPAYRIFLEEKGAHDLLLNPFNPDLSLIPVTDKESFVKKYSIASRCRGGIIPTKGVVIDESSGSSGVPMNWVRGLEERMVNRRMLKFALAKLTHNEPLFIINAFALGPWATGMNVTMSFASHTIVKSLGPDIPKILQALKMFGKDHHYVIMGYPPFLKALCDSNEVAWKEYRITMIYGGEGMSLGMRSYLEEKGITKIYSSFGASDLELNMASENDFTIALRRKIAENPRLAEKLCNYPGSLPMLFQYNPADFLIESSDEGELIISICRPHYTAPKLRYNIHDRGHTMDFKELEAIIKELGMAMSDIGTPLTDLPLLFHYGRADMAVSFYGCKVSPNDIQETIFRLPGLAQYVNSFMLKTWEDGLLNKKLRVCIELNTAGIGLQEKEYEEIFFKELRLLNQDFSESSRMLPEGCKPRLEFYLPNQGPFENMDVRIKRKYIE